MSDVGGVGEGPSNAGGVGEAEGPGAEGGLSGTDAAAVEAAAADVSPAEVDAQAQHVADSVEDPDGFEAAAPGVVGVGTAAAPRGPTEGTLAEMDRRADEAAAMTVEAASGRRGPSEGTMAEIDRRSDEAAALEAGGRRGPSEGTLAEIDRRSEEAAAALSPRGPTEGTLAEIGRRESAALNELADFLGHHSKTAADLLSAFRAAGGQIQGVTRGGFFDGRFATPMIGLPRDQLAVQLQVLAHELGHFDFSKHPDRTFVGPGTPTGKTDRQIEHQRQADFITNNTNVQLADEGHATLVSGRIRDELQASTGINIGIAGGPFPVVSGTLAEQRNALGNFYGTYRETAGTLQNYRSYYGEAWRDIYDRNYLP